MPSFLRTIALIAVAALSLSAATAVQAKIVIPCTGERLVTVVEIPKDKQPPDETIDIGYLFPGCFGEGKWVGVAGHDKYYTMTEQLERTLLDRAGLSALPPVPSRLEYPFQALLVETLTLGVLIIYALFGLAKRLFRRRPQDVTSA
jgi:hypothetical protein